MRSCKRKFIDDLLDMNRLKAGNVRLDVGPRRRFW
jgi:hypothetical protein